MPAACIHARHHAGTAALVAAFQNLPATGSPSNSRLCGASHNPGDPIPQLSFGVLVVRHVWNCLAKWQPKAWFGMAMKKLVIPAIMAAVVQCVCAVEYVTLSNSNREINIAQGSLVEIVACTAWQEQAESWNLRLELTLAAGDVVNVPVFVGSAAPILKQKFTGLSKAKISLKSGDPIKDALTLKITPVSEIGNAGPKTVLVIPEGSSGEFDVVIESSGDMVTWTPMHSQGVTGNGPQTFFRTRIIKK
jgi:hypothetical protein